VLFLVVGVTGAILRPRGVPAWVVPGVTAALAVAAGVVPHPDVEFRPLAAPIAFLLVAIPMAVMLDRAGFFTAAAQVLGHREHLVLGLWVLGAVVTAVLNLDAAVVLLTPLYVRVARRCGLDPAALAFQPVLLSCLASSALPVSNLTNLIAASSRHLEPSGFLAHLGAPALAATFVGWFAYRAVLRPGKPARPDTGTVDRRALAIGGAVVTAVLIGFVVGPSVGIPEWAVAAGADMVLIGITRSIPLRTVPWGTALVAASLGLLAGGAAAHFPLDRVLGGSSNADLVRITAVSAVGANLVNNLPALIVALPHTGAGIWALLLGVNIGPLVLFTGTLAALLWQASLSRLDVQISAGRFARVGLQVMLPALGAAVAVLLVLRPVVGG
jgi:arsenical pump membrane protein